MHTHTHTHTHTVSVVSLTRPCFFFCEGFPAVDNIHVDPAHGSYTREPIVFMEDLTNHTISRICEVYLSDYCCFGFDLPPACLHLSPCSTDAIARKPRVALFDAELEAALTDTRNKNEGDVEVKWEPRQVPHMYKQAAVFVQTRL